MNVSKKLRKNEVNKKVFYFEMRTRVVSKWFSVHDESSSFTYFVFVCGGDSWKAATTGE